MNANASFASRSPEERHAIIQSTLERALNDERIEDIAKDFGLARSVLNYNLLSHANDEWRDTQAARALTALQIAQEQMEAASDGLALAKAREQLKSAQWELEKLLRRLYGEDKSAIILNAAGNIQVQVVSFAETQRTIEQESVDSNTGVMLNDSKADQVSDVAVRHEPT